jgi:putative SOS response-associated peptidase YedK
MKDGAPFAFAGLFERWLSPEGEVLDTCTIVTTRSNALLAQLHDRMPVIVAPVAFDRWLDVANEDTAELFAPYPADAMTYFPVSVRVNSVRNDDAQLIVRVEEGESHATATETDPPPASPEQDSLF